MLGCLVLSITTFTCTNVFRGHRWLNAHRRYQRYQYERNFLPPRTRHEMKEKKRHPRRRHLKDAGAASDAVSNITEILRGDMPFPSDFSRLKYRPGRLDMSSAEALQYCHVDTLFYRNHIRAKKSTLVSASKHHKLLYRNVPKSASRYLILSIFVFVSLFPSLMNL
jgi:hypothetical protein